MVSGADHPGQAPTAPRSQPTHAQVSWARSTLGLDISATSRNSDKQNSAGHDNAVVMASGGSGHAKPRVIDMSDDNDVIEGIDLTPKVITERTMAVNNRALTNAAVAGVQILNACQTFQGYAEKKLDDMHEDAPELLSLLMDGLGGVVGGVIAEKLAKELAKVVLDKINDAVKASIIDAAKKGLSNSSSNKALKEAITKLTSAATDSGTVFVKVATEVLQPKLDGISKQVTELVKAAKASKGHGLSKEENEKILSKDQHDLIAKFLSATETSQLDGYIETMGIPAPQSAKKLQIGVYKHLVRQWELAIVKHEMYADGEINDMAMVTPGYKDQMKAEIIRRADMRAEQAGSAREKEMQEKGQ